jgi:hypothetical protein
MKKTITIEVTTKEAYALLRALATANEAEQTPETDHSPNTWVAKRLVRELEENGLPIEEGRMCIAHFTEIPCWRCQREADVRNGLPVKPLPCQGCGRNPKDGHHAECSKNPKPRRSGEASSGA